MKPWILMLMVLVSVSSFAQQRVDQEPLVFDSPEQQDRFNDLTEELRCLVCQNQNLADSDAPLAHDLREEIFTMMQSGQSDTEIKSFLMERYGDFVLYRPPLQGNTLVLWLAPAVLLFGGGVMVVLNIRKRNRLFAENSKKDQT